MNCSTLIDSRVSGKKKWNNMCTASQGGGDQLNSSGLLSQGDSLGAEQDAME